MQAEPTSPPILLFKLLEQLEVSGQNVVTCQDKYQFRTISFPGLTGINLATTHLPPNIVPSLYPQCYRLVAPFSTTSPHNPVICLLVVL